jgi:hypothetical protein
MLETGLRPKTLDQLRVPEHYTRGAEVLRITAGIDNNEYTRTLPLTDAARAALVRARVSSLAATTTARSDGRSDGRRLPDGHKSFRWPARAQSPCTSTALGWPSSSRAWSEPRRRREGHRGDGRSE